MGCQKKCYFCHSKCCLPDNGHQQCETQFHYFNGYSGVGNRTTNKLRFWKCTSQTNLRDRLWYIGDEEFSDGFELLQAQAPNWVDSINKAYAAGNQDFISEKEKKCAVAIEEILLKKYERVQSEETEQWKELEFQRLHVPITIEGYLSVK